MSQLSLLTTLADRKALVLQVLSKHRGAACGITVADLAEAAGVPERAVRAAVSDLREEGIAVCAHPTQGYFLANSPQELERCCQFLRSRAMHSLKLEARLRNVALPDLIGQLHLKT